MSHFRTEGDSIVVSLDPDERRFLSDVVPMLVGLTPGDPGGERLRLPVYLGDPEADEEWWRLMGSELAETHGADRRIFARMVGTPGEAALDDAEADAVLRTLNQARLVLGSRLGVRVEADYEGLEPEGRWVLDFFALLQEELVDELSRRL